MTLRAAVALSTLVLAPLSVSGHAQTGDPKALEAVSAASRYVAGYLKEFSAIVCEERQTQTLTKPDGRVSQTRELVSDLMFVKVGESWVPLVFRDVISVDGKPVRNRSDRLRKLFVDNPKTAVEQARAIAKESGRYNLGIDRQGNSPLLPAFVFDPHLVGRFKFELSEQTLTYEELERPTFLGFSRAGGRGNLPAHGSAMIDLTKGTILSAALTAESPDAPVSTKFAVNYKEEPAVKMLVPVEMTESYWLPAKPKDDRLEAKMTYSAFRRFQVTTTEIIK